MGGRDVVPLIARVGVSESVKGGKAFAQLYAALALRHFGDDLKQNAIWQSLSESDRTAWTLLLDPTRFYNPATRHVIDLPENYLGVASRVATLSFQMGVLEDRAFVDSLIDRAAEPFVKGALYADDAGTQGRYDRYSNEYARYVYEAAETVGREDIIAALQPTLTAQMKLWWDLVSPDGYGYPVGPEPRRGQLSRHPRRSSRSSPRIPSSGPRRFPIWRASIASRGSGCGRTTTTERIVLSVFAPGRGNYAYIIEGPRVAADRRLLRQGPDGAGHPDEASSRPRRSTSFPEHPTLPDVARFEFFRRGDRPAGVWLVRQGPLRFALPITSGTKPGVADYLPAPARASRLRAFPSSRPTPRAPPTSRCPTGGSSIATDGADEIVPAADGRSVRATWRRFVVKGGKTGEWVEPGFEVSNTWTAPRLRSVDLKR